VGSVRLAAPADLPHLRGVLERAFDGDAVVNWVIRQDGGRQAAFRWVFQLTLDMAMPLGHVYTTDDRLGVAIWTPPGKLGAGQWRQVWQIPGYIRAIGLDRASRVARAVAALNAKHPRRAHWYLTELAVDPPVQGRGIGSALLADRLATCDRDRVPAYLENSNPRNRPLYERHGFRVLEEHRLGGDGPPVWLMWRDASRLQAAE
jgi:ribosomal protein S18 acetylase RimI-like enzyme